MNAFIVLAILWRWLRRVLSLEIAHIPRWRKEKAIPRPQTYLKRDIHQKKLASPFRGDPWYRRAWQTLIVQNRFAIAFTALLLACGLWFFMVFLTPTFYIKRVVVQGATELDPQDIRALVEQHLRMRHWFFVPYSHRLFLGLGTLRETIASKYDLEFLRFEPDWTANVLQITLQEKPSLFVYGVANRYFAIDKEGKTIRELTEDQSKAFQVPVIYEYDSATPPQVGQAVLNRNAIVAIQRLNDGFATYAQTMQIHSFRLRISPQQEITITDDPPSTESEKTKQDSETKQLAKAAESIAQAQTVSDKVQALKKALETLDIERLEEGKLDQLLREQRVYSPLEGYKYQELEIYTKQGWSLKVGHDILEDATAADYVLNIFATLEQQINLKEVREYIDLRIPNRVYYR